MTNEESIGVLNSNKGPIRKGQVKTKNFSFYKPGDKGTQKISYFTDSDYLDIFPIREGESRLS